MKTTLNKKEAYNAVNKPYKLSDGSDEYDEVWTTVYYKNVHPQLVRRSTFDNPHTDISLDDAVLITIVIHTYKLKNNDWEYVETIHINFEVED